MNISRYKSPLLFIIGCWVVFVALNYFFKSLGIVEAIKDATYWMLPVTAGALLMVMVVYPYLNIRSKDK